MKSDLPTLENAADLDYCVQGRHACDVADLLDAKGIQRRHDRRCLDAANEVQRRAPARRAGAEDDIPDEDQDEDIIDDMGAEADVPGPTL